MKTIAIDARKLRASTGRYIERLLYYLQQIDNNHKYLVLLQPKDMDGWEPANKHFVKVACPYKEFTFAEQIGFLKQLKQLKPDLVHFCMVQQPIIYRGKVVTTMHDLTTVRFRNPTKNWLVVTIKQQVYKWVNRVAAHKSKAIITPTEFVKEDVAKFAHINSRKITVTLEAADTIKDAPEVVEGLENQQFIMYVGQPTPHKNLERLVEAFNILKKDNRSLKLVLAGKRDANYKRIERGVRDSMTADVIFAGFVSEGQLRWLYEHTAAYVFPSLSEGFGLPGLEAMLAGAPVASSNATCLPEVYGDAAEYFDPLDVEAMAAAIGKVINDKSRADVLREKGKKQAAKYSWRRTAEQTLEVYKEVLGE
jgi:glycosyltransferase involved in cell wall biosynthesis